MTTVGNFNFSQSEFKDLTCSDIYLRNDKKIKSLNNVVQIDANSIKLGNPSGNQKIYLGNIDENKVLITTTDGEITGENYLPTYRGGLGKNIDSEIANNKFLKKVNDEIVGVDAPSVEITDYSLTLKKLADEVSGGKFLHYDVQTNEDSKYQVIADNKLMINNDGDLKYDQGFLSTKLMLGENESNYASDYQKLTCNVQSTDDTWNNIFTFNFYNNSKQRKLILKYKLFGSCNDGGLTASLFKSGEYLMLCSDSLNSGTPYLLNEEFNEISQKDSGMEDCEISYDSSQRIFSIKVKGLASKTINWTAIVTTFLCQV